MDYVYIARWRFYDVKTDSKGKLHRRAFSTWHDANLFLSGIGAGTWRIFSSGVYEVEMN